MNSKTVHERDVDASAQFFTDPQFRQFTTREYPSLHVSGAARRGMEEKWRGESGIIRHSVHIRALCHEDAAPIHVLHIIITIMSYTAQSCDPNLVSLP